MPKLKKHSTDQVIHISLCGEWVSMEFFPMFIVEHTRFQNLINHTNIRIKNISNDKNDEVTREIKMGREFDGMNVFFRFRRLML